MLTFFKNRQIPVEFRDVPPTNLIDQTPFQTSIYNQINSNGLSISPLKLIHCASIHYQGRFRKSVSLRWLHSLLELTTSLSNYRTDGLYLTDSESNEFQTRSSEVLAVGLGVFLATKLFQINNNRISVIEGTGKRCDFSAIKNGEEIIFETKGRKYKTDINSAVKDVFIKKRNYPINFKYGMISHFPRNNEAVRMVVIDPESHNSELNRNDMIVRLLIHYAKQSYIAGFWRLADLLNERVKKLLAGSNINEFENVPLDYQNIYKIGRGYEIRYQDFSLVTFFPAPKGHGFYQKIENKIFFFSMDKRLIHILEQQSFNDIIEYQCANFTDDIIRVNEGNFFSINKDGSVLSVMEEDEIPM